MARLERGLVKREAGASVVPDTAAPAPAASNDHLQSAIEGAAPAASNDRLQSAIEGLRALSARG
jgi:hypothetical protein